MNQQEQISKQVELVGHMFSNEVGEVESYPLIEVISVLAAEGDPDTVRFLAAYLYVSESTAGPQKFFNAARELTTVLAFSGLSENQIRTFDLAVQRFILNTPIKS